MGQLEFSSAGKTAECSLKEKFGWETLVAPDTSVHLKKFNDWEIRWPIYKEESIDVA